MFRNAIRVAGCCKAISTVNAKVRVNYLQINRPMLEKCRFLATKPPLEVVVTSSKNSTSPSKSYPDVEKDIASMQRQLRELFREGDFEGAIAVTDECLKTVDNHLGSQHPVYASLLNNKALFLKNMGELEKATETYEEAIKIYEETVGKNHQNYATALHNCGLVFRAMATTNQAKGLEKMRFLDNALLNFEDSLRVRKNILAPDHPDIATCMCNIGVTYCHLNKMDKAEAILKEALSMLDKKVGRSHVLTALAMNNLGLVYKEQKKFDLAIDLYKLVIPIREKQMGDVHPETIMAKHNLAEALKAAGRDSEALALRNHILSHVREEPSDNQD